MKHDLKPSRLIRVYEQQKLINELTNLLYRHRGDHHGGLHDYAHGDPDFRGDAVWPRAPDGRYTTGIIGIV